MRKKKRRSDKIVLTKEARVLKFMRLSRNLSMRKAASIVGTSCAMIAHLDCGRADITDKWIFKLISAYGYTYEEFKEYVQNKKRLPDDTFNDCIVLLRKLPIEKLRAVYGILQSF